MYLLSNSIKAYAWGSFTALPVFLGRPSPAPAPQAELWMGAHPAGSSQLWAQGRQYSLEAFCRLHPEALGAGWRSLPFLLKVLAVEKPLSLQVHPNLLEARQGHAQERALGLPLEESHFPDANHKPELLCALTPFKALLGFEKPACLLPLLKALALPGLQACLPLLRQEDEALALRSFFESLLRWPKAERCALLAQAKRGLRGLAQEGPWAQKAALAVRLLEDYPEDMGALASLCLNLVQLEPLEAVFVPAGCPHAYVHGMGVELMANSDNVLRGGLSTKRVDVEAFLSLLCFEGGAPPVQKALPQAGEAWAFKTPAKEFCLSLARVSPQAPFAGRCKGPEIGLVLEGEVAAQGPGGTLRLRRGQSVFIPAQAPPYLLMGRGLVALATTALEDGGTRVWPPG